MPSLAPILTSRDLPQAELSAARLDGELFAVDECFAPVDEVETPWLRARALAAQFGDRVVVGGSALWVHGAVVSPPGLHDGLQRRLTSVRRYGRVVVHEGAMPACDVRTIGGVRVSTEIRTAVDHARRAPGDIVPLARLLLNGGITAGECLSWLDRAPRMPGGRGARRLFARIVAAAPQPAFTR